MIIYKEVRKLLEKERSLRETKVECLDIIKTAEAIEFDADTDGKPKTAIITCNIKNELKELI